MKTINYVLAVAWKEIQLILKDRGLLGTLFLLPLLVGSISAAPTTMSLQAEESGEAAILLNVCLVTEDAGPFGVEVAKVVKSIKELKVETLQNAADAEDRVAKGKAAAAIIIPADFSQKINDYLPTTVEVIVDPAQPESASIVTGIMNQAVGEVAIWGEVQYGIRSLLDESGLLTGVSPEAQRGVEVQSLGVVMTRINEMRSSPAIAVVSEDLSGVQVEGKWQELFLAYIFAGFTVMFIFFVVGAAAKSLLDERETGVLRRLVASPIPRGAIITGKVLAYMLIPCLQVVLLFGLAHIAFGVNLGQSPAGLAILTLSVALSATALGVMLAALVKTAKQAENLGMVLGFVLAGISGAVAFNPNIMFFRAEGFMGILARLTPQAHAVEGYYSLMAEKAGLVDILPQIGILLVMSVLFILIARWRFKFVV